MSRRRRAPGRVCHPAGGRPAETFPVDVIQGMFPDRQNDFVLSIDETDVALIQQMPDKSGAEALEAVAQSHRGDAAGGRRRPSSWASARLAAPAGSGQEL